MPRLTLLLTLCLGCTPSADSSPTRVARQFDTLATLPPEAIPYPLASGGYAVLPYRESKVEVYDSTGRLVVQFGRSGQGPGEFLGARGLAIRGDTIAVVDIGNLRLVRFLVSGTFLGTTPLPSSSSGYLLEVLPADTILTATGGEHEALAVLRAPDGSIIARYGKPVVPPTAVYMFGDIRKAIAARRIPDEFKNMILPMKGRHDDVWLLSLESGQLWRFHRSGRLLATGGVPPEYLKARQEAFFDAGVHTPPESVPFPDIIRGAVVTKNGVVVELAQSDSAPARLMMFDTLGTVIGDEVLPPLPSRVGLIQDSYHDRVLYYDTETGALLAAHQ